LVEQGHSRGPRGLTPGELYERARELGVEGRARMAPGELKRAILATLARAPERRAPAEPSRAALYARAQALGIARRSRMSKAELAEAVAAAEATGTG
ncbi:MAG: hypothetical protein R3181_00425, partial [Rubricoccaceae bacterium]|nr:hypothetical protein [Rubricoccaceae bacterium]